MFQKRVQDIIERWKNTPVVETALRYLAVFRLSDRGVNVSAQAKTYLKIVAFEETVTVHNADTTKALVNQLPANCRVLFAQMNFDTAVGLTTAVKVGLGTVANPDALAISGTTVTKNASTNNPTPDATGVITTATTDLGVNSVDTGGSAAGTFNATATIRVRVVYEVADAITAAP